MSIRALRSFVTIAQHGSFAAAAEKLGLTQPAVSLQIKKLEEELDAVLFDRSSQRSILNPAGQLLLPEAKAVLAHYDSLKGLVTHNDAYSGPITIGAINTVQVGPLAMVLRDIQVEYPRLQVMLRSGMSNDLAVDVEAGRIDFAIATEPQATLSPQLIWQPCYQEEFCVVAPKGVTETEPKALLEAHPYIRFDRQLWAGRMVERRLQNDGIRVSNVMDLDSLEAALRMVEASVGVAVVSLSMVRKRELQHLKVIPFNNPPFIRPMGLIYKQGTRWKQILDSFASLLQRYS